MRIGRVAGSATREIVRSPASGIPAGLARTGEGRQFQASFDKAQARASQAGGPPDAGVSRLRAGTAESRVERPAGNRSGTIGRTSSRNVRHREVQAARTHAVIARFALARNRQPKRKRLPDSAVKALRSLASIFDVAILDASIDERDDAVVLVVATDEGAQAELSLSRAGGEWCVGIVRAEAADAERLLAAEQVLTAGFQAAGLGRSVLLDRREEAGFD